MSTIIIMVPAILMAAMEDMLRKANERHYFKHICDKAKDTYAFIFACVLCWTGKA